MIEGPNIDDNYLLRESGPDVVKELQTISDFVLIAFYSLFFITSLVTNFLFLVIYFTKPSLKNVSNKFILSLCLGNVTKAVLLFTCMFIDTLFLAGLQPYYPYMCQCFSGITDFVITLSVLNTTSIAVDRYLAILNPLHYHSLMTKCRGVTLIVCSWIFSALVGILNSFRYQHRNSWKVCSSYPEERRWESILFSSLSFLLCFSLPFIVILWSYSKIYIAAQENSERTRRSSRCSSQDSVLCQPVVSRTSSLKSVSSQLVSNLKRRISNASLFLYKEEARAAKISVVVVLCFLICFFPYYGINFIFSMPQQVSTTVTVYKVGVLLAYLDGTLSPYIYILRSKKIKSELRKFFGIVRQKKVVLPYRHINLDQPSFLNTWTEDKLMSVKE